MADYQDKVVKDMAVDKIRTINEWRKEFTKPFSKSEINQLKKLSDAVDKLWQRHAEMQRDIDDRTTDPLFIFGQIAPKDKRQPTTTEFKDRILQQEMFSKNVRNSSQYRRLKLVMDYWCALWFWPIEKADLLPSRAEFLFDLTLVLEGNLFDADVDEKGQQLLFPDTRPKQMSLNMLDEFGYVNVDKLCKENVRLELVKNLALKYRYLHWEIEFAYLFGSHGGFDLVLGNPPWIQVRWEEGNVLGDTEPLFMLRKYSSTKLNQLRLEIINKFNFKNEYFNNHEISIGTQNYLKAYQNYPEISGMKINFYHCFINQAWLINSKTGVSALLHPQGIYEDPKGEVLRKEVYKKLIYHFQFQNELKLFPEVDHHTKFSINIYNNKSINSVSINYLANLFHPQTIYSCFSHNGIGGVPGIKNKDNKNEEDNLRGNIKLLGKVYNYFNDKVGIIYNKQAILLIFIFLRLCALAPCIIISLFLICNLPFCLQF